MCSTVIMNLRRQLPLECYDTPMPKLWNQGGSPHGIGARFSSDVENIYDEFIWKGTIGVILYTVYIWTYVSRSSRPPKL